MANFTGDENSIADQQKFILTISNHSFAPALKNQQSKLKALMNSVFSLILLPYAHTNHDVNLQELHGDIWREATASHIRLRVKIKAFPILSTYYWNIHHCIFQPKNRKKRKDEYTTFSHNSYLIYFAGNQLKSNALRNLVEVPKLSFKIPD